MGKIYNNIPFDLSRGCIVPQYSNMTKSQINNDSINSMLERGSMVIPAKYSKKVLNELNKRHESIYGRKADPKNEIHCVVMPNELIVNKTKVKQVDKILKKLHIVLPNYY